MPKLAKQNSSRQYYYDEVYKLNDFQSGRYIHEVPRRTYERPRIVRKKTKPENRLSRALAVIVMILLGVFVLPISYGKITKMMFAPTPLKTVKADYYNMLFPTTNYLSNDWFLGTRALRGAEVKKPLMNTLTENVRMSGLENRIKDFWRTELRI